MTPIHLDLDIYPLDLIKHGIAAYRNIADVSTEGFDGNTVSLSFVAGEDYDENRAVDEFLNYLIALLAKANKVP